jgi:hypothetical protein
MKLTDIPQQQKNNNPLIWKIFAKDMLSPAKNIFFKQCRRGQQTTWFCKICPDIFISCCDFRVLHFAVDKVG